MEYMNGRVEIVKGDITKRSVDAIVNAANKSLLGGGGVDGAIHRAAGPELLKECKTLGGAETGEAKITGGFKLSAKHVIHTVGPVWHGGNSEEEELLANCYRKSLYLAKENEVKTIAFPCISTGVYGYPIEKAAAVAQREVKSFLEQDESIEKVFFVCFGDRDYDIYLKTAEKLLGE